MALRTSVPFTLISCHLTCGELRGGVDSRELCVFSHHITHTHTPTTSANRAEYWSIFPLLINASPSSSVRVNFHWRPEGKLFTGSLRPRYRCLCGHKAQRRTANKTKHSIMSSGKNAPGTEKWVCYFKTKETHHQCCTCQVSTKLNLKRYCFVVPEVTKWLIQYVCV